MEKLRCGVVGLGNMGGGIAANLGEAGLLTAAWDSNTAATARIVAAYGGISVDPTMLNDCDVVIMVVPGSAEISALIDEGYISAGRGGRILLDLTTSQPADTIALAQRMGESGYAYVDAGMTGGASAAAEGRLTLMAGGDRAVLDRLAPVFEAIATKVFHLGPVGAGHTMKLVHNMICHSIFLATAEGCRAAAKAGIDLESCVNVLNAGNARSFVSERRFPDHIVSGTFDGRSHTANLAKDLAMARKLFADLHQPAPYVALTETLLAAGLEAGLGENDFTRLFLHYDDLARHD